MPPRPRTRPSPPPSATGWWSSPTIRASPSGRGEGCQGAVAALAAGAEVAFHGATGAVDFDNNGDIVKDTILIWQVQGEAIVTVESRPIDLTQPVV